MSSLCSCAAAVSRGSEDTGSQPFWERSELTSVTTSSAIGLEEVPVSPPSPLLPPPEPPLPLPPPSPALSSSEPASSSSGEEEAVTCASWEVLPSAGEESSGASVGSSKKSSPEEASGTDASLL